MIVTIDWSHVEHSEDPNLNSTRVLYAYVNPKNDEILYVGQAYGMTSSVLQRLRGKHKGALFQDLIEGRGISEFEIIVGDLSLEDGRRLSPELMTDVETLLIYRLDPWANQQARVSRTSRPGLTIRCIGESWPHERSEFRDR